MRRKYTRVKGIISEISSHDPYHNIAVETYLFNSHKNDVRLFLWQNEPSVIFGRNQNTAAEADLSYMHAFAVRRSDNEGILVHIGVDTVNLKGQGFKVLKKQGASVNAGEPIVLADLNIIKKAGLDTTVMLVITEPTTEGKKENFDSIDIVEKNQIINH
jgi:Phosphotransferase system IIA components